jgi:rubrerythrin
VSVSERVASDHQLARLLQIGIVLEEVVEARASHHYRALAAEASVDLEPEVAELLQEASEESAEHRERLEALVDELDAETVPFEEIEGLVREKYGQSRPEDFDGVLYDQLAGEETAYKFYDDLIEAIEASDASFSIDRDRLLDALAAIREEEAEGVEEVTDIMGRR